MIHAPPSLGDVCYWKTTSSSIVHTIMHSVSPTGEVLPLEKFSHWQTTGVYLEGVSSGILHKNRLEHPRYVHLGVCMQRSMHIYIHVYTVSYMGTGCPDALEIVGPK